jgi:anti-sigma regulatory factor (Ser/Thr protein kinase)
MLTFDISTLEPEEVIRQVDAQLTDPAECEMELTFRAHFPLSRHVRETLAYLLRRNGIDERWQNRFALISDELVNNSIEHGSCPTDINSFYMKLGKAADGFLTLTLEVTDTGHGPNAKDAKEMVELLAEKRKTWLTDTTRKRGRGFQIMEKLVDKLYFRDATKGGLTVGIHKKFDAAAMTVK